MAGWQSYIDVHLVGTGQVRKAAICGLDGTVWAKSGNFNVQPAEVKKIVAAFSAPDSLYQSGLFLEGTKYITTAVEDYRIRGKLGSTGLHIVKTNQAVIICHYDEAIQPGNCAAVCEKLADYLKAPDTNNKHFCALYTTPSYNTGLRQKSQQPSASSFSSFVRVTVILV